MGFSLGKIETDRRGFIVLGALGTAIAAASGTVIIPELLRGTSIEPVTYDPNKIFSNPTFHQLSKNTEPTLPPKIAVGEQNFAEFFLGDLIGQFKQRRRQRYVSEPGFAERIDQKFLYADRINFLYLGLDLTRERPFNFNSNGKGLSDIIMLISFNPHTFKTVALSLPRDLFTPEMTRYFPQAPKLNTTTATESSDPYELPKKIVESATGVPIDGVLKTNIDFMQGSFGQRGIFDQLFPEGLKVFSVPERIEDFEYPWGYGWQRVVFETGEQVMDGHRLTEYARTRHADLDFGRSSRQREVLQVTMKNLLPRILGDLAAGKTGTLDLVISSFQTQKDGDNLFFDVNIIEILRVVRDGIANLRGKPEGIAALGALTLNSQDVARDILFGREGSFVSFGPSFENGEVVTVGREEFLGDTYLLKPAGVRLNTRPTLNGNYLDYWQAIREKVKKLF